MMETDPMAVPTYIIYRDIQPGEAYNAAASPVFYPPKDSDELFDALRAKYPRISTHSERMRNAVIEFLLEEREAEAIAAANAAAELYTPELPPTQSISDTPSPWTHQSWPSVSSTTLSSPDMSSLGTPAAMNSPNLRTSAPKESSPISLDGMTSVFSLTASLQPKQRLRRKMTEAEKTEYRQRRLMKACEKCAKRKRKCTHSQVTTEAPGSRTAKPPKPSTPASQHEIAVEADSSTNLPEAQDVDYRASTQPGPSHTEQGSNDFTLLFDELMPDIDGDGSMFDNIADLRSIEPSIDSTAAERMHPQSFGWQETGGRTLDRFNDYIPFVLDLAKGRATPTHISPALLDSSTCCGTGQSSSQTMQNQVGGRHGHLAPVQDETQIQVEHSAGDPMAAEQYANDFQCNTVFNKDAPCELRHSTLAPGRHPFHGYSSGSLSPDASTSECAAFLSKAAGLTNLVATEGELFASIQSSHSSSPATPTILSSNPSGDRLSAEPRSGKATQSSILANSIDTARSPSAAVLPFSATSTTPAVSKTLQSGWSPSQNSIFSVASKLFDAPAPTPAELFMLRRRTTSPSSLDFSRVIQARSVASPVSATSVDTQLALRAQQALQHGVSPFHSSVSTTVDQSSDESASTLSSSSQTLQTLPLQHVGRLSDHVRYKDHHGRRPLQTVLQICCAVLAVVWSCSPLAITTGLLAASAIAYLDFTGLGERKAALNLFSSGACRFGKALAVRSPATLLIAQ